MSDNQLLPEPDRNASEHELHTDAETTRTLHGRPVQRTLASIQDLVRDRIPVIGASAASALGHLVDNPASERRDDTSDRDDRP